MTSYLVIPPYDDTRVIDPGDYPSSYEALRQNVGGYIECVELGEGFDMWVNEEGKLEGLPCNFRATHLFNLVFGPNVDLIVGTVVITGGVDDEGNTLGLDQATIAGLRLVLEGN